MGWGGTQQLGPLLAIFVLLGEPLRASEWLHTVTFPHPTPESVSFVVYGNESTGFYRSSRLVWKPGSIQFSLVPPEFDRPIRFVLESEQGQVFAGERVFKAPKKNPASFRQVGAAKAPFLLIARRAGTRAWVEILNRSGQVVWQKIGQTSDHPQPYAWALGDGHLAFLDVGASLFQRVEMTGKVLWSEPAAGFLPLFLQRSWKEWFLLGKKSETRRQGQLRVRQAPYLATGLSTTPKGGVLHSIPDWQQVRVLDANLTPHYSVGSSSSDTYRVSPFEKPWDARFLPNGNLLVLLKTANGGWQPVEIRLRKKRGLWVKTFGTPQGKRGGKLFFFKNTVAAFYPPGLYQEFDFSTGQKLGEWTFPDTVTSLVPLTSLGGDRPVYGDLKALM